MYDCVNNFIQRYTLRIRDDDDDEEGKPLSPVTTRSLQAISLFMIEPQLQDTSVTPSHSKQAPWWHCS